MTSVAHGDAPEEIVPGVWAMGMSFGQSATLTNCYLLRGSAGITIVDPGFFSRDNCERLESGISHLGFHLSDEVRVYATHLHIDHIGMAPWLEHRTSIVLALHRADAHDVLTSEYLARFSEPAEEIAGRFGVPQTDFERVGDLRNLAAEQGPKQVATFDDVGSCDVDGRPVRILHTPGHTRGHSCMVMEHDGVVLTGDHILEGMRPGVGLGLVAESDPVSDYLQSLRDMAPFDDFTALPGHGNPFGPLGPRRERLSQLLQERLEQVRGVAHDEMTTWQVAQHVSWSRDFETMEGVRLRSALTQTELMIRHLRLSSTG